MQLNLKNAIVFFDLETTGLNFSKDRIIEISMLKIFPDEKEKSMTKRVNPEIPIPPESTAIHGIRNEDVKNLPPFKTVAKDIAKFFKGCDVAGYNSIRFDIPFLVEELLRVNIDFNIKKHKMIDVQTIFHKMEQRTLSAAYKFYCKKELTNAHSAEVDTRATYEILKSQLDRYEKLQNDVQFLSNFSIQRKTADFAGFIGYNKKGEEVFTFGKNKNVAITKILKEDPGYFSWILKSDFPLYTKKVLNEIKLRLKMA